MVLAKLHKILKLFSLSEHQHDRLEIGSGSVRMHLDEDLEERISFWTSVWSVMNPVKREKNSESWKDPKAFRAPDENVTVKSKIEL